ncbi:MAG: hypothetical protein AB7T63_17280 [Planctomycetota bacterium]
MALSGTRAWVLGACAVVIAGATAWFALQRDEPHAPPASQAQGVDPATSTSESNAAAARDAGEIVGGPQRVDVNPDAETARAFDGDVHPELDPRSTLVMNATWTGVDLDGPGGTRMDRYVGMEDQGPFELGARELQMLTRPPLAQATKTYSARELSQLLPPALESVGQVWSMEPERWLPFLTQFHPGASVRFEGYTTPYGRRPGPAGAFGIVRTLSADRAELQFRVHAEFILAPGVYYTPACFVGRLLLDRTQKRAMWFQVAVPTQRSINVTVHLTGKHPETGVPTATMRFDRVREMALAGGEPVPKAEATPADGISVREAEARLKHQFYKFMDISWVPITKAQELAREQDRPLLVAVLTSPLDDQSC